MVQAAKILVVDDDPDFLESTRLVLEGASYRVTVAADEDEALVHMQAETPDLLILDVMMSGWDSGFRFAWKLKADDRFRAVPILIVTGVDKKYRTDFACHANSPNPTADDEAYLPVEGYIVKPATISGLLGNVKRILKRAWRLAAPE